MLINPKTLRIYITYSHPHPWMIASTEYVSIIAPLLLQHQKSYNNFLRSIYRLFKRLKTFYSLAQNGTINWPHGLHQTDAMRPWNNHHYFSFFCLIIPFIIFDWSLLSFIPLLSFGCICLCLSWLCHVKFQIQYDEKAVSTIPVGLKM